MSFIKFWHLRGHHGPRVSKLFQVYQFSTISSLGVDQFGKNWVTLTQDREDWHMKEKFDL